MADEARAGHPERVADGDGTAVHVVDLGVDLEPVPAVHALRGEGLVELPEIDVADPEPGLFEELRHRKHRADPHLVRLAAGHREAAEVGERLEIELAGALLTHDEGH